MLTALVIAGCAPLSESIVPLGRSDAHNTESFARLMVDLKHPVIIQGFNGEPLEQVRVPSALPSWTHLVPPGDHLFWLVGAPYGAPLLPQRLRCYAITGRFESGHTYILSENIDAKAVSLLRQGIAEPIATGPMIDNPFILERRCQWR